MKYSGNQIRKRWLRRIVTMVGLLALCFWAFYIGLTLRRYEVETDKLPQNQGVRIVAITDLHSHIYGKDQKPLIDMIAAQQPDIIALVGDIADDHEPDDGTRLLLAGIKSIAPMYYVSGNHEFWSDNYDDIKGMLEGYGVSVLDNESKEIIINGVRLCISGVDDPLMFDYTKDADYHAMGNQKQLFLQRFSQLNDDVFNILLAHRPELIDLYRQYGFDLVLSGHTHGGQVRVPLLINGLFAPDQGWFPKYAGGRYDFDDQTLIVSRGLAFNDFVPRVFNPPEVVVVDIKGR